MPKTIYHTGDQYAEVGTVGWANWQRSLLKIALKDVNYKARPLVHVIRAMCEGDTPAWHLMTYKDGQGFRTFEAFVTSSDGLQFPDYPKFKAIATSEAGIMNAREYELLTTAADGRRDNDRWNNKNGLKERSYSLAKRENNTKTQGLRAIARAPLLIRQLYIAGLINTDLARLLGPDPTQPHAAERQLQADRALHAIQALSNTGDDAAYRQAVNDAVRQAFALRRTPAEKPKRLPKDPRKLIAMARQEYGDDYLTTLLDALMKEPLHA